MQIDFSSSFSASNLFFSFKPAWDSESTRSIDGDLPKSESKIEQNSQMYDQRKRMNVEGIAGLARADLVDRIRMGITS